MKFVVTADSLENAKKYVDLGVDVVLVGHKDLSNKMQGYLTTEELKELKAYAKNTEVYFNANLICHDYIIEMYKDLFATLKELNIDGIYVSDVALIKLSEEYGLKDLVIYNPETLITNSFDANYYLNQGIKAITLSKEITLEDYQKIASKVNGSLEIIGFGHYSMFHTKRHIVRNYNEYRKIDKDFTANPNLRIREELRSEYYPLLEEETTSTIFRSNATNVYKSLNDLGFISYMRLDGVFKSFELMEEVITAFKEKRENPGTERDLDNDLAVKYNEETDTGFLFKKTVYGK